MPNISAVYGGDLCVRCVNEKTGATIDIESLLEDYGKGSSFSPTDLVAAALGSCAMNVMAIWAHKNGIELKGTKINIIKTMSSNSTGIAAIEVEFVMPHGNFTDKEKKIMERCVNGCPVHKSLGENVRQSFKFVWPA